MLNVLDLFSGIGGFSLGLERTGGFRTVAFCEIEPFPRRVLAKHWPGVPCYDDVRTLTADRLRADGVSVDVICGGFPCQDISIAGGADRPGLDGERSGLWSEIARLAGELRPRYVVLENVAALLGRGLDRVLGDLASLGYTAEWECIPAGALGAPHIRDRFWLVGYPDRDGQPALAFDGEASWLSGVAADAGGDDAQGIEPGGSDTQGWSGPFERPTGSLPASLGGFWSAEPDVGRVVDGLSARLDGHRGARLKALGNAVVPQVVELLGRAILAREAA